MCRETIVLWVNVWVFERVFVFCALRDQRPESSTPRHNLVCNIFIWINFEACWAACLRTICSKIALGRDCKASWRPKESCVLIFLEPMVDGVRNFSILFRGSSNLLSPFYWYYSPVLVLSYKLQIESKASQEAFEKLFFYNCWVDKYYFSQSLV